MVDPDRQRLWTEFKISILQKISKNIPQTKTKNFIKNSLLNTTKISTSLFSKTVGTGAVLLHALVALSVIGLVALSSGYQPETATAANFLESSGGFGGTVDETASAYIAASIAQEVELAVAEEVAANAQTVSSKAYSTVGSDAYLSKAQIVATNAKTKRDIEIYTVKSGDTVSKLAEKFGVTTNTIRWANDINEGIDILSAGASLTIPPVSGVLHTVKDGDTPEKLAEYYNTNARDIVSFNDAEISGLKVGEKIVVPEGRQPAPVAPQVPVRVATATASFSSVWGGGNGYSYGYCTWHTANRRADIGKRIPTNWGNAISWRYNAAASGFTVSSTPVAGAVAYEYGIGGLGHVAFVEAVRPNGNVYVSDMNYPYWGVVTYREVSADRFLYVY